MLLHAGMQVPRYTEFNCPVMAGGEMEILTDLSG